MQVSQGTTPTATAPPPARCWACCTGARRSQRWLAPFNDEIRTTVAGLYESSLTRVAERMGRLAGLVAAQLKRR